MERLQKVLAAANLVSRRKAETLILQKRVKVNNQIVYELGTKVSPSDVITVDNTLITKTPLFYYLLNKPQGYLSTAKDNKTRQTVLDLIIEAKTQRLYPVGRLDFNTTGLLLITNDGDLTQKLTHPFFDVQKEYHVKINAFLSNKDLAVFRKGILIDKNYLSIPQEVLILKHRRLPQPSTWLKIVITEGKNRQIRKMMEALGHKVLKLKRYRYSFLTIKGLKTGDYRLLKINEIKKLKTLTNQKQK
ncbi:pseudouridine synthase [Candidatus Phytoplasma solani]|uniref:Pseudouridine synthase n=3 Tax=Candidatus Phytoplasma solani TaxID=69896 RepID=A0A421NXE5_9MOLU|nr:pseudouridine synthase [Candidatus Phytoplasma solani]RMI88676.1 16S rRNA pseudouridylate synthase [Candidatus Phytoplasma solani]CCP88156.1 16S rRNA pseudouridylate synthase [Candidatus Phytoplasma solani]